jgi:hypothetical protein
MRHNSPKPDNPGSVINIVILDNCTLVIFYMQGILLISSDDLPDFLLQFFFQQHRAVIG